jgi:hypothetical protein
LESVLLIIAGLPVNVLLDNRTVGRTIGY